VVKLQRLFRHARMSGLLMIGALVLGLAVANSPFKLLYD